MLSQWPISAGEPVTVPFLDDTSSYLHAVMGFGLSRVPLHAAILFGLGFMIYQFNETEPLATKIGDFGELLTGLGLGLVTKGVI